jgi:hypothetical protein
VSALNFKRLALSAAFIGGVAALASAAPNLTVGSVSGQAGTTVNLPITFDPTTSAVAGIQFNVTLPAGVTPSTVTAGAIITAASKNINTNLVGNVWTVIVFGVNQTTIGSGTLLTVAVTIPAGTALGPLSLPLSSVVYTDANAQSIAAGTNTNGTITVVPAIPVITSSTTATGRVGVAFSYQITASNNPTSFNATGLPAGLSVNTATGLISGTPSVAIVSTVTLSAINSGGTGTRNLILTILPQTPVITSSAAATGQINVAFSYQIAATNNPTSFNATGMPAGLTINTVTGLISGTPSSVGISTIALSATNAGGTGSRSLLLTVNPPPPAVTSASAATARVNLAFTYQITATNNPTSYNASGLPAGLTVNPANGLISGTPSTTGVSLVAISAFNAGGNGTQTLTLSIFTMCDLDANGSTDITDLQLAVNQAIGVVPCLNDISRDGVCNVIDVQRVANVILGGLCVSP